VILIAVTVVASSAFGLLTLGDVVHGDRTWRPSWLAGSFLRDDLRWLVLVLPLAWARRIGVGVIVTVALVFFALPLAVAGLGFLVYFLGFEGLFWLLLLAWRSSPLPGPTGPINPPQILRRFSGPG